MMKSDSLFWVLLGLLFLTTGTAHAQVACPLGMVPYGTGQDRSVCGPDNSQQQSAQQQPQPAPIWVSKWGAIATDFSHTSAGASVDEVSRESADQAAIANCQSNGGLTCKVELTYSNGCSALAVGRTGHNAKAGATIAIASQAAMKVCSAADTGCFIYYTACSLPVRVQ